MLVGNFLSSILYITIYQFSMHNLMAAQFIFALFSGKSEDSSVSSGVSRRRPATPDRSKLESKPAESLSKSAVKVGQNVCNVVLTVT